MCQGFSPAWLARLDAAKGVVPSVLVKRSYALVAVLTGVHAFRRFWTLCRLVGCDCKHAAGA